MVSPRDVNNFQKSENQMQSRNSVQMILAADDPMSLFWRPVTGVNFEGILPQSYTIFHHGVMAADWLSNIYMKRSGIVVGIVDFMVVVS